MDIFGHIDSQIWHLKFSEITNSQEIQILPFTKTLEFSEISQKNIKFTEIYQKNISKYQEIRQKISHFDVKNETIAKPCRIEKILFFFLNIRATATMEEGFPRTEFSVRERNWEKMILNGFMHGGLETCCTCI